MQQYNCQVGQSWFDVCANTYGTLDYIGKLLNDNNASLDVFPFTGQQIQWDNTIVKDSSVQALISANGYVFNTGNNISSKIQSYTAGTSTIDFTNNGGDDWTVGFKIAVSDLPSGYNVVSYDYDVNFIVGGSGTHIAAGNKTVDYDVNTSGNGAGAYVISCTYNISDGVTNLPFYMRHLIKVDNVGNVLGAIKNNGVIVNSVNGLTIDYTAFLTQIGVSGQINVDAVDSTTYDLTNLSHNLNDTVTLPIGTGGFIVYAELDPTFWADLGGLLGNTLATCNTYPTIIS